MVNNMHRDIDSGVERVADVIARFGGQTALGLAIGVGQSTVSQWLRRGVVPARQIPRIMAAARLLGISLAYADFFEAAAATPKPQPSPASEAA